MWNITPPWRLWTGNFYENNTVGDNGKAIYGDVRDIYNISVRGKDQSFFNVLDYDKHKNRIDKRVKSTCDWVLQDDTFKDWLQNPEGSIMCVTAYPGCGKSVLSRALVDEKIVGADGCTTLYFFFQDTRKQRMITSALCSLLHQLFKTRPDLFRKHAQIALKEVGESLKYEFQALWDLFFRAASDPEAGKIVCVLDGFDECEPDGRYNLLNQLEETYLQFSAKSSQVDLKLRFFITCRPYPDFDSYLAKFPRRCLFRIRDEDCVRLISEDVNRVAEVLVEELAQTKGFSSDLKARILHQLCRNTQRTYLWIRIVCRRLGKQQHFNETDWLASIESLRQTGTVDELYESFLTHTEDSAKTLAILTIVIGAKRPLTLKELGVALAVNQRSSANAEITPLGEAAMEHMVRSLCGFLLSISDTRIYLFHPTVKEFLVRSSDTMTTGRAGVWRHWLQQEDCDRTMAETCMAYLLSKDVQNRAGSLANEFQSSDAEAEPSDLGGLLDYAATFWAEHYRAVENESYDLLSGLARDLCRVDSASYDLWFPIFWWRRTGRSSKIGYFTDIGVATFLGHKTTVSRLLSDGIGVDANCGEFGFPLYISAWTGDKSMSELLLQKGADINQVNGRHGNALYAALTNRKNDVVFLLLEHNADVHVWGGLYGTVLQAAAVRGDDEVVQALLKRGANVNATSQEGYWPDALTAATWRSHESTAKILLEAGATIQYTEHNNPLYGACFNNHEGLVRLFLENNVNVNSCGGELGHPLQAAAWRASVNIVQLLLDHGANIDAQGGFFGTALAAASYRGEEAIVRLLLESGAEQLEGGEFGNPRRAASENEQYHIKFILLEAMKKAGHTQRALGSRS